MKYSYFLIFFSVITFIKPGHGQTSTLPLCPLSNNISLDSLIEIYLSEASESKASKYHGNGLSRFFAAMDEEPLDSLFQLTIRLMKERLGETLFCDRIKVNPSSFSYWQGQVDFEYEFQYADTILRKSHRSRIKFRFDKKENGLYEFMPPDNLPDCVAYPDLCVFDYLSLAEAVYAAQDKGLIDIAYPFDIRADWNNYEILIRIMEEGFIRHIKRDMRSGKIDQDSIALNEYSYDGEPSLRQIEEASLIVEAERIKRTKGYKAKGYIHTSHIFKVNKIFKGRLLRDTIEIPQIGGEMNGQFVSVSHNVQLPRKGILLLKDLPESKLYQSEDSLQHYPRKRITSKPIDYGWIRNSQLPPWWARNVEGLLYKKLEAQTGQQYRIVSTLIVTDTNVINQLSDAIIEQGHFLMDKGILLNIQRAELRAEQNELEVFVSGCSSNGFTYPTKMKFVIRYNPAAFGEDLAAKSKVVINRNISQHSVGIELIPKAFFSKSYTYNVKDIASGLIEITFNRRDSSVAPVQLLPQANDHLFHYKQLLFSFRLPIVSDSVGIGLQLENEPFSNDFYHYDYHAEEEKPYAFNQVAGVLNYPISDKNRPIILSFKSVIENHNGEAVFEVYGKNFLRERTVISLRCEQEYNGRIYTRYCRLPDDNYIHRSDQKIKFTIPEALPCAANWLSEMKPTSGTFYVINEVGDEDILVESEEELILPK